jgi:hypothetical protein
VLTQRCNRKHCDECDLQKNKLKKPSMSLLIMAHPAHAAWYHLAWEVKVRTDALCHQQHGPGALLSTLFPVFIVFYCTCSHRIIWSVADCIFSLTSAGLGSDMCSILKVCTHIQLTLFQQTLEKEFHLPLHCCGALTADIWITHLLNLKSSALEGKVASPPCPRQKDGFLRTLSLVTHPLLKNTT